MVEQSCLNSSVLELERPDAGVLEYRRMDMLYLVDWLAALLLFVVTLPLMVAAAMWVFAVDRGNPFFVQERVGLGLLPYRMFKIRTMRQSSEKAMFCAEDDDRILPGGRLLRKTRIDELPQLLNVLMGRMALVGPRPEQVPFVAQFLRTIPGYEKRFRVKPGITGWAQVTQGYVDCEDGTREKLRLDLEFVRRRSMRFWWRIAVNTVRVVLTGDGAR